MHAHAQCAAESVGVVEPQRAHFDAPLPLKSGGTLPAYEEGLNAVRIQQIGIPGL